MPAQITNLVVALVVLKNVADRKKALATAVASAYTPGLLGLALPLIVARSQSNVNTTTDSGTLVKVPDVIGKLELDATTLIAAHNLNPVPRSFFTREQGIVKGTIFDQDPKPGLGLFVELGTDVILKVSLGAPPDAPPDDTDLDRQIQKDVQVAKEEIVATQAQIDAIGKKILDAIAAKDAPKLSAPGQKP